MKPCIIFRSCHEQDNKKALSASWAIARVSICASLTYRAITAVAVPLVGPSRSWRVHPPSCVRNRRGRQPFPRGRSANKACGYFCENDCGWKPKRCFIRNGFGVAVGAFECIRELSARGPRWATVSHPHVHVHWQRSISSARDPWLL